MIRKKKKSMIVTSLMNRKKKISIIVTSLKNKKKKIINDFYAF